MEKLPTKSYKVTEVAKILGCCTDHVYRMVKYGNLEAFKVGGRASIRITDIALNDFIERMRVRKEEFRDGQD